MATVGDVGLEIVLELREQFVGEPYSPRLRMAIVDQFERLAQRKGVEDHFYAVSWDEDRAVNFHVHDEYLCVAHVGDHVEWCAGSENQCRP